MLKFSQILAVAGCGFALLGIASGAARAEFPDRPIEIVIPFAAGGGSDVLARAVQAAVEAHDLAPVPIVVTNIDGAGGVSGMREILRADPDGYRILQVHQEMFAKAATGSADFGPLDFDPIFQAAESCLYLAVPASAPYQTFDDFIAHAKAHPGEIKFADIIGGVTHFPIAQMKQTFGVELGVVQVGGTSARFASLEGGFTQAALMSAGWIERGGDKLRGLVWFGPERTPLAPDMPTAAEVGLDTDVGCLRRRYYAPKGTPPERIQYLADLLARAVKTAEVQDALAKALETDISLSGAALIAAIETELAQFKAAAHLVTGTAAQ